MSTISWNNSSWYNLNTITIKENNITIQRLGLKHLKKTMSMIQQVTNLATMILLVVTKIQLVARRIKTQVQTRILTTTMAKQLSKNQTKLIMLILMPINYDFLHLI